MFFLSNHGWFTPCFPPPSDCFHCVPIYTWRSKMEQPEILQVQQKWTKCWGIQSLFVVSFLNFLHKKVNLYLIVGGHNFWPRVCIVFKYWHNSSAVVFYTPAVVNVLSRLCFCAQNKSLHALAIQSQSNLSLISLQFRCYLWADCSILCHCTQVTQWNGKNMDKA